MDIPSERSERGRERGEKRGEGLFFIYFFWKREKREKRARVRDEELRRGNLDMSLKQRKQLTSTKKDAIIFMRGYCL